MSSAGAERRPGRPREQRYSLEELLDVVAREFLRRGYDATSMEDLSRATGRTKSSIYHHVSGKEELLRLAVARALDALFAVLQEEGASSGPAVDRLEHVLRSSVRVLAAELPYVTLLLRVRGNSATERWAIGERRRFDHLVADLVTQAADDGDVRSDVDPGLVTRLLFGMINSLVEWYDPDAGTALAAEPLADAVVRLAFDGLRATP
jgi:AcrR family transcriptional regulator